MGLINMHIIYIYKNSSEDSSISDNMIHFYVKINMVIFGLVADGVVVSTNLIGRLKSLQGIFPT
jgi:hypothetical protein